MKSAYPKNFKPNLNSLGLLLSLAGVLNAACVTVNVNFPESAAQNATDDYVRELYRAKEKGKPSPEPLPAKQSRAYSLFNEAIAAENFNVRTPATQQIQARQLARLDEILDYERKGVLGENSAGKLVLKSSTGLKPLEQKRVAALVKEENSDRDDLYAETLRANHLGSNHLRNVEQSFARSYQSLSPSHTWIEDKEGNWAQKP